MTIDWSLLVPGVLLLLFPADLLLSSNIELRSFECFQSLHNSPRHRPWWWVPALWIDPLRAYFGALLLVRAFSVNTAFWALMPKPAYTLLVSLLAAAVLCQLYTRREAAAVLLAPMGFVAGLAAALTPWSAALLATVTAGLGLFGARQFQAYFVAGAAAVVLFGFVIDAEVMWIWPAAGAFALPALIALVSGKTLELPTRNSTGSQTGSQPAGG